jgi:Hemerythrin HHE cation binding domain
MSIVDKVIAAVTPQESDQARAEARARARAAAGREDWLATILTQHISIEAQFKAVKSATDPVAKKDALKMLGTLLTGHSMAEEAVIYPALALADEKGHATKAYAEQSAAKMQMGALENLDPSSQEFSDKLKHLEGAVLHHVYEEEGSWFLDLAHSKSVDQAKLTLRFKEEFDRYMGKDAVARTSGDAASERSMPPQDVAPTPRL